MSLVGKKFPNLSVDAMNEMFELYSSYGDDGIQFQQYIECIFVPYNLYLNQGYLNTQNFKAKKFIIGIDAVTTATPIKGLRDNMLATKSIIELLTIIPIIETRKNFFNWREFFLPIEKVNSACPQNETIINRA